MRSFICVVVSTLFATVACYEEFQCTFPDEDLVPAVDERIVDQHVWGHDVKPLEFQTEEEFKSFEKQLIETKRVFYTENIFDTTDSFFNLFDESRQYDYEFEPGETYSDKIRDFSVGYTPTALGSDNLGLLVKFLRKASEQIPIVKNHAFFGVYAGGVQKEDLVNYESDDPTPEELDNEFPVGLIKVSVGGKLGYIVIDMELARTDLVMENSLLPNKTGPKTGGLEVSYELDKSQKYIRVNLHEYNDATETFSPPIRTDLIYVGRPLCSFVETHVRYTLLYPQTVKILAYGPDFELDGSLVAEVFKQPGASRFRLTHRITKKAEDGEVVFSYATKNFEDDDDFNDDFELNFFSSAAVAIFNAQEDMSRLILMGKIQTVQKRPYRPRAD